MDAARERIESSRTDDSLSKVAIDDSFPTISFAIRIAFATCSIPEVFRPEILPRDMRPVNYVTTPLG